MLKDLVTSYALPEPEEGESSIQLVQASLGVASELQLVVVSGGPVFLFKGGIGAEEAYVGTHSPNAAYHICAGVGMVACCFAEPAIGQVTICSDSASIGYFRQVQQIANPGERYS